MRCRRSYAVNPSAVREVSKALSAFTLSDALAIEVFDPQLVSIKEASSACGSLTPTLTYLNALVSYALSCRGEDYWKEFSTYLGRVCAEGAPTDFAGAVDLVLSFIGSSRCNRVGASRKALRIRRLSRASAVRGLMGSEDYVGLWRATYSALGSEPYSKTVVFSVKMYYYGLRALRPSVNPLPHEIPIPADRRISRLTFRLGLVNGFDSWRDLFRCPEAVASAWLEVSRDVGIPPLHIDSVIWPSLGGQLGKGMPARLRRKLEVFRAWLHSR